MICFAINDFYKNRTQIYRIFLTQKHDKQQLQFKSMQPVVLFYLAHVDFCDVNPFSFYLLQGLR